MADYAHPKSGVEYIFFTGLTSQANTKLLQNSPTIAAGDFQVSKDGGAFANLTTLPAVTPAGGVSVKISLSAAEMTGDNITVACVDAAGFQWCDKLINIQTAPNELIRVNVEEVDGVAASIAAGIEVLPNGIDADSLTDEACEKLADIARRRTQQNVEGSAYGDALSLASEYGLIQQAQESNAVVTEGVLTVYETNGTTILGTKNLDTDSAAEPIVGVS